MRWNNTIGLVALATLSPALANGAAQKATPGGLSKQEASIPFANLDSTIRSWQADGQDGLWIQDANRQWYYATTYGYCEGLEFAARLGFKTGTLNTLDRFSSIVVPGYDQCAIKSLVESDAPPNGTRHEDASQIKDENSQPD